MKSNYKILIIIFLIINLGFIKAQFSGAYTPANWGTVAVNSDGITNSSAAPVSIYMTSGDNQSGLPGSNDYTITVPQTGLISFSWIYTTVDGAPYDYPQYGVNGNISIVNGFNTGGGTSQSGSQPCVAVNQGDIFRFRMYTVDNVVGPATCTFSNFAFSTGNLTITPASPSVCPGGTVSLTASGGSNYSWSGGISNGVAFSPSASAVYTVSSGTGLCITSRTVFLTYNPPLTIIGPTSNICTNSTATLIASGGSTYSWSTGASAPSIVITPSVSSTFTVYGTSTAGCNTQGVKTVTVDFTPTVTAVSNNTTNGSCPNTPITLSGTGATAYSWTGGVTNGVPFTPPVSSSYTVTGTNACGSATAAISVSIHPLPPVTASANNPTVCTGNSVVLNGGGAITYTWTPSVPNNVPFFPSSTQNYTVRGTSALGCTASAVQGVTVLITPTITPVVTPTAICLGGSATLSAVGATGYTWTPGTNLNTATVAVSPPGPTTYTLFRTNGACSSTSTVSLVVNPLPLVNATASPSQICAGMGINLVVVGPITNTWLPGGFTMANFMVYPNFSTTYTVTGSNGNCTATAVVPIIVNTSPVISITSSTNTICEGQTVNLTANGTGALTYTWQPMNTNNATATTSPPTTTLVSLEATNLAGCTTTVTQLIIVNPVPNMNISSNMPYICAGNTASLSITSPTPNVVYNWSSGPAGTSILVSPTITTNYFVTGTNTITTCQNTNTITLSVYISTFVVSSPTAICLGQTATLTAAGDATTYAWSANGNVIAPSASLITVSPVLNTTYNVIGTNGSCQNTVSVPMIVHPIPNVTASAAKSQICRFEISTIQGNGATSYSWNTGATTQTISFTLSITTTYTVTGTDVNGCAKTVTVTQFVATCIGMEDIKVSGDPGIRIYPNPNNGNFVVSSDVNITVSIVNTLGQVVSTIKLSGENPDSYRDEITVSSLPAGVYFITGQSNGVKVNKKIIVER